MGYFKGYRIIIFQIYYNALFEKTKQSYISSLGYLVKLTYKDNKLKILTVKQASELLNISAHKIRQLAKGKPSSRTSLPANIEQIDLIIKDSNWS